MKSKLSILKNRVFYPCKNIIAILLVLCYSPLSTALASQYTEKQLDALATRVGKTYWVTSVNNRTPSFLSAPARNASSFHAQPDESFEITELAGQKTNDPYYKVRFASGKEGYMPPEAFLEEFNLTILTVDPQADEKKKAAEAADADKERVQWIQAQPWSKAVKDAALKRQPVPGMNTGEIKKVVGNPSRVTKIQAPQRFSEEHWFYADGSVLIFQNGLLTRVETKDKKGQGTP